MNSTPPKFVEAIVSLVIPPACREHVLGDLHERCTSAQQYIVDALSTVPRVILSQIRRTNDPQTSLIAGLSLCGSFLGAASWMEGSAFLHEQGLWRLAIPILAALAAFVLAAAYSIPGKWRRHQPFMHAGIAISCAFLSQAVLLAITSSLVLPIRTMAVGGSVSVLLLSALRVLFPPVHGALRMATQGAGTVIPSNDIDQRLREFQRNVRWGNVSLFLSVLMLGGLGLHALVSQPMAGRAAGGVILAATLYILYQVYKRSSAGPILTTSAGPVSRDFYRIQLERRRDALLSIRSWFVWPYLAGLMTFALRLPLAASDRPGLWPNILPFVVLSVIWSVSIVRFSERAARKLQDEIDTL